MTWTIIRPQKIQTHTVHTIWVAEVCLEHTDIIWQQPSKAELGWLCVTSFVQNSLAVLLIYSKALLPLLAMALHLSHGKIVTQGLATQKILWIISSPPYLGRLVYWLPWAGIPLLKGKGAVGPWHIPPHSSICMTVKRIWEVGQCTYFGPGTLHIKQSVCKGGRGSS